MATGFLKRTDGDWAYADQDGALVSGWVRHGGQWYYLNAAGKMATGWVRTGVPGTTCRPPERWSPALT